MRWRLIAWSRGNSLVFFWRLYRWQRRAKTRPGRDILTFFLSRSAHRHGGYLGPGAEIQGIPSLPHGLHGVFISRYAVLGPDCCI